MGLSRFITSSAGQLEAHAAHKPLFSPLSITDTLFYDDGPVVITHKRPTKNDISGSLNNLSSSYPFLQGVELTKQTQYDAGLVKIWSGDPQHVLKPCVFGQDKNYFPNPGFADLDLFDPVRYLELQEAGSPLWQNIITYPIVTGDNDQAENFNFNGIIEPFPIREVISFFSINVPYEAHTIRAGFAGGNDNIINGSDQVLTVDYFAPSQQIVGFLDMVDIINETTTLSGSWSSGSWSGGIPHSGSYVGLGIFSASFVESGTPLNGYFRFEFTSILPFSDTRYVRNAVPNDDDEQPDMIAALSLMTGSTDNYVRFDEVSAACGWYYDNNAQIGTDSLAFGGMTY